LFPPALQPQLTLKATPARKDDSNSKDAAGAKDKEPQTPHTTVKPSPLSSPEPTPPRPKLDLDISMEDLEIKELDGEVGMLKAGWGQ
jgi:hypothetical protein